MDILLINHYAGSVRHGMEYRPFYMGREWTRMGHRVTIAAASCSHVRTVAAAIDGALSEESVEGVRYLWFKTPPYAGNGARRALNMFAFVGQLFRHVDRLAEICARGAVIASSTYPLDMLPAAAIARAAHARLAFEVHDLWPLSPMELGGMSPFHPFILLMQSAENFAYRHAQKVISMLPKAAPHMRRHGLAAGKFVHVPNGIDAGEWLSDAAELPGEHREALAKIKRNGGFAVVYAGAHGLANALDSVVRAADFLRDTAATIVLVGQGPEKPGLQELAAGLNLQNVLFLPPVKKKAIPTLLAEAGALVISLRRTPLFRFGISPNKLIDYMMAGKPVIQAVDAGNDMVMESGCGISVPPEDPRAIAGAIVQLMRLTSAERAEMGARGRGYALARHDYRVLAKDFIEALQTA
jgi:glycosyltransferase involved in cell wall biosynthesis